MNIEKKLARFTYLILVLQMLITVTQAKLLTTSE